MQRTSAHRPLPPMTCVEEHYTTAITQETEGRHAGERSRTFTGLRPTDFESAASAIPPLRRLNGNLSDREAYCKIGVLRAMKAFNTEAQSEQRKRRQTGRRHANRQASQRSHRAARSGRWRAFCRRWALAGRSWLAGRRIRSRLPFRRRGGRPRANRVPTARCRLGPA